LASNTGTESFSPDGVPGVGTELPSSGEVSGAGTRTSSLSQMEGLNKSSVNTPIGGWFTTRPESSEGIDCLVVSPEDMMKLKIIEFLLQPP
jgi:hypothetical protein